MQFLEFKTGVIKHLAMKYFLKFLKTLLLLAIISSCSDDKRITIKIIEAKNGYYEWYYYSLITSDGPDFVDYIDGNCERTLIYKGHRVNDVKLKKGKLYIECYECNTIEFNAMFKNQIQIIENNNSKDYSNASRIRDSLIRNEKSKKCN